ncbi:hypothetical protein [Rhizobium giardinii]|uniref:hypothetical protein n=1 Tax=Rhizobium giardinii TaxID=56731 RepID=UPI003D6FA0E4
MIRNYFVAALLCAIPGLAVAEDIASTSWKITNGEPESVLLEEDFGLVRRLFDQQFGDGFWNLTVHEFTSSRSARNPYKTIVQTNGNSVTLRIPRRMITGSSTSAPGDRKTIPIGLWYHDGKLTEKFTGDTSVRYPAYREHHIQLIIESVRESATPRPVRDPTIRGADDQDIERSLAAYAGLARPSRVTYSGKSYCGFDVFSTFGFKIPNKLMRDLQKPPLTYGNLLIARENNRITRKIECVPSTTSPACHTTDYILDWVPIKVSFNGKDICQVDAILDSVKKWIEQHVVSQTTTGNIPSEDSL